MGIFDNVTSITINDKEVASIEVDGGSIYTKSSGESRNITFTVKDIENNPVESASVSIDGEYSGDTGSDGGYTVLVQDGTHTIGVYKEISRDVYIRYTGSITVNSDNTHFDIVLEESQQ